MSHMSVMITPTDKRAPGYEPLWHATISTPTGEDVRHGVETPHYGMICMSHELEHPAMTATVQEVENLWLQRYGRDWQDSTEVLKDAFFRVAYARLKNLGRIEETYLADKNKAVCRLPL
jgi:hypothetical protein